MPFKLNISDKGKAWKLEIESEILAGKNIGDKLEGKEISADLSGYELEITGATDFAGFPHSKDIEGPEKHRVLLTRGFGLHKRPRKEGKKKVSTPKGLRYRKSIRGSQISDKTTQINLKVLKQGSKKLPEIFPDQNKSPEPEKKEEAPTSTESPAPDTPSDSDNNQATDNNKNPETPKDNNMENPEEKAEEEVKEEIKEEVKETIPDSPETDTEEKKEEAAEKVAEEVVEESKEAIDKAAEDEEKKE